MPAKRKYKAPVHVSIVLESSARLNITNRVRFGHADSFNAWILQAIDAAISARPLTRAESIQYEDGSNLEVTVSEDGMSGFAEIKNPASMS